MRFTRLGSVDEITRVAEQLGYPRRRPQLDHAENRRKAEAEGREHVRKARELASSDKITKIRYSSDIKESK
jgi:hypothetical protein